MATVDSTSDTRTVNNTMRHQYRVLSDGEKANMQAIKDAGLAFHDQIAGLGASREVSLAKTKVEEAVMWAVKHITAAAVLVALIAGGQVFAQEKDRLVTLTSQEANNFLQVTGALDQCVGASLTRSDIAPCRALAVFLGAFVDRIKNAPEAPEKK